MPAIPRPRRRRRRTDSTSPARPEGQPLPVWGLSLATGLTDLLAEPASRSARSPSTASHTVERVTDPDRIAAITALVGSSDVLADGHHRYGISRVYRDEIRDESGSRDTPPSSRSRSSASWWPSS